MVCKVCNKEFKPKDKENIYCSRSCYLAATKRKTITAVCLCCGKEFVVGRDSKGKYCSKECLFKYQSEVATMCRELKQDIKQLTTEAQKIKVMMYKGLLKESKRFDNIITKVCVVCGKQFTTTRLSKKYCSVKCNSKLKHIKNDKRIYRNGKPDLSITLSKLYERDKGICQECGIVCDWHDIDTRDDGTLVAGDSYPSIDHIVPIAKGGLHQWDNVQLLCRHCNSVKRDR